MSEKTEILSCCQMIKKLHDLVPEPNSYSREWVTKWFSETLIAIEIRKVKVYLKTSVCLGFSILDIRKIEMHEF